MNAEGSPHVSRDHIPCCHHARLGQNEHMRNPACPEKWLTLALEHHTRRSPALAMRLSDAGVYESLFAEISSLQDDPRFLAWKTQSHTDWVHIVVEIDESKTDSSLVRPTVRRRGVRVDATFQWDPATVENRLLGSPVSGAVRDLVDEVLSRASTRLTGVTWPPLLEKSASGAAQDEPSDLEVRVPLVVRAGSWPMNVEDVVDAFADELDNREAGDIDDAEEEGPEMCFYLSGNELRPLMAVARKVLDDFGLLAEAYAIREEAGTSRRVRLDFASVRE